MKKLFVLVLIIVFFVGVANSEMNTDPQTCTVFPQNGKFEIITSSITMRDTYMLNNVTGDTWQLVKNGDSYAWVKLFRERNPDDKIPEGHKGAVYQITMSGIAAKGIYLTNTLTGASWCLFTDSKTGAFLWVVIASPQIN